MRAIARFLLAIALSLLSSANTLKELLTIQ
jgi:hypothetical protein